MTRNEDEPRSKAKPSHPDSSMKAVKSAMESERTEGSTQSQPDKFRDLARELGCDEDEAVFKAKLRKIVQTPPQPREKPGSE